MYHERTVLSTFALCFLAKILVDASYEGERGAAVPIDIVAALTNDLSLRQWRTLVRYMLRMMLGIRSQQRERQALRMLEVSYRHVVGNDSLYCNGFDADECHDREQVGWNLVRLSLGFDFNLGGQWPAMWTDCMLEGGTNRHQRCPDTDCRRSRIPRQPSAAAPAGCRATGPGPERRMAGADRA